ncbi:MAG: hypothetical protein P8X73_04085 [Ignavibacteriaceae bacterium]
MMKLYFWLLLLYIFASSALAQIDSEIFLDGATVTGIAQDDENLWVATYGQGIYKYSTTEQKWENFSTKSNNLDDDLFYTIEVNKDY